MDSFTVSRLKSEKEEILLKLNKTLMENNILTKQLEQLNKDHGELILNERESQLQLTELRNESELLKQKLTRAIQESQRLKNEFEAKTREIPSEIKLLKKQNEHLSEENGSLEFRKMKLEQELGDYKVQSEVYKMEIVRLKEESEELRKREKKVLEKLSEVENEKMENLKLKMKNSSLERDFSGVLAAATERFRAFEKRVSELERVVANLIASSSVSGSQLVDNTDVMQEQESFGPEAKCEGLVGAPSGHETTPNEEKTASSMPGPYVVDLCGSDDDEGEQPSQQGLKRKLPHDESVKSKKIWDYEADILEDLQKDTELCMEGVCALSRQHMLYAFRETLLAKFLLDGDAQGRLKKTLADLEKHEPKGANECKRIALSRSKQLLDIYKNGKDPFFAPDTIYYPK